MPPPPTASTAAPCELRVLDPARHIDALLAVWRSAVEATHHFVRPDDLVAIAEELRVALPSCRPMVGAFDAGDRLRGFMHAADGAVQMLFVDAPWRGRGVGTALLHHAIQALGASQVEVNTQNGPAVAFYRRQGFEGVGERPHDDCGRPYPLLVMRHSGARGAPAHRATA